MGAEVESGVGGRLGDGRPALVVLRGWAQLRLLIEVGIAPELLEGAEVVVDGGVVGALTRMGVRTLSGFKVGDGDHSVEVRLEGYASRSMTVNPASQGGSALLLADFGQVSDGDGASIDAVVLY